MAFRFEIPSYITGSIEKSSFRFYTTENSGNGLIEVYEISKSWNSGSLTYEVTENSTAKIAEKACYGIDGVHEIDVTSYINDVISGIKENNGFYLHFKEPLNFFDPDSQRKKENTYDCDTLTQWALYGNYDPLEIVAVNRAVYSANEYPNNLWGGLAGYTPGTATGDIAWTKVAECIPRDMTIYSSEYEDISLRPELVIEDGKTDNKSMQELTKNSDCVFMLKDCVRISNNNIESVKIYDVSGRIVFEESLNQVKSLTLNIMKKDLPKGVLILKLLGVEDWRAVAFVNK